MTPAAYATTKFSEFLKILIKIFGLAPLLAYAGITEIPTPSLPIQKLKNQEYQE